MSRPRPLSSQTRSWGDDNSAPNTSSSANETREIKGKALAKQDSWTLNSDDWPASPPRPARKEIHTSRYELTDSRGMFSNAVSSKPVSTAHLANKTNIQTNRPAQEQKKRSLPWADLEKHPGSRPVRPKQFHELSSTSDKVVRARAAKGDMLNIQQKVVLSPEQQLILQNVVGEGKNVFFTGSAGTGKSVLLREIIKGLKKKYASRPDAVAVTASTGMAACNIGGTTIHSFAGIGLGIEQTGVLIGKIKKNRTALGRWTRIKCLVIDEISMLDGVLFDKLSGIAQGTRQNQLPFGGIQLIVTGDFFQLPPVTKGHEVRFAFEAKAWKEAIDITVNLKQVFRQKSSDFIEMLNEMRFGELKPESIAKFRALAREPKYQDNLSPTELFPRREEVDNANKRRLESLTGETVEFLAEDLPRPKPGERPNAILSNFMAMEKLVLKEGAQVMLIKNLTPELVNGTIGTVIGFGIPQAEGDQEEDNILKEEKKKGKNIELGPIVRWMTPYGEQTQTMVREEFKVEDHLGKRVASRKQYPIILAWAMSIHKSQGQTIPRVKVDLRKVFEKGQSYVALSRATCLEHLQVLGFEAKKVEAHPKVVQWSKTLSTVQL